jgi:hypothetical protein
MGKNRNRLQVKLSHKGDQNGYSEYEHEFLRTPENGPLVTDDMYAEIDSLEYFSDEILLRYRNKFKKLMNRYSDDYIKIEAGILSYVNSSKERTKELAVLVKSILEAYDSIITDEYDKSDESTKQLINRNYFEEFDWLNNFEIHQNDLISKDAINHYVSLANQITNEALIGLIKYTKEKLGNHNAISNYEDLPLYKGVNHSNYYNEKQQKADIISAYSGLENQPYFERLLLTSYTLSIDVSQKFESGTVNHKGQRRLLIDTIIKCIEKRIFSSWIISENFLKMQFEILCLPNSNNIIAHWNSNNTIEASMSLKESV